jgi:hypothetical protein
VQPALSQNLTVATAVASRVEAAREWNATEIARRKRWQPMDRQLRLTGRRTGAN